MKNNLKNSRRIVAIVGIFIGMTTMPVSRAFADGTNPDIFPAEENVFGMTYGDWSAAWWQYGLSVPKATNPVLDTTGVNCGAGQSAGPVFFLVGAATTDPVTRLCTVPTGKALVFPIINIECSTVESPPFFGNNGQALRTCAAAFADGVDPGTLNATVDGKKVKNLKDFRVQSPVFDFLPTADNYLDLPGMTSGLSVSDGYWLIVEPLSAGNHVIHFEGAFASGPGAGFSQDVTYNLTAQ